MQNSSEKSLCKNSIPLLRKKSSPYMCSDMLFGNKVLFGFCFCLTDEEKRAGGLLFRFFYFVTCIFNNSGLYSIEIHLPVVGLS